MIRISQILSTSFKFLVNKIVSVWYRAHHEISRYHCPLCLLECDSAAGFCEGCLNDLPWNESSCAKCALPLPTSFLEKRRLCGECIQTERAFDVAIAPFRFEFPVDQCIKQFKYFGNRNLGKALATLFVQELMMDSEGLPDLMIPVPSDPSRSRERPLQHSEVLTQIIAKQLDVPFSAKLIRKIKSTPSQAGLTKAQRKENLRDAFECKSSIIDQSVRKVAIIDDVMTTGSTAEAIAKLLKSEGIADVEIWTLARTDNRRLN